MVETEVDTAFFSVVTEGNENAVQMVYNVATLHIQCLTSCVKTAEVK